MELHVIKSVKLVLTQGERLLKLPRQKMKIRAFDIERARLILKLLRLILLSQVITLIIVFFVNPKIGLVYSVLIFTVCLATGIAYFQVLRYRTKQAVRIYTVFLLGMTLTTAYMGAGIRSHGIKFLPVIVLFSGIMLGRRVTWFAGLAAVGGCFLLALAEHFEYIETKQNLGSSPFIHALHMTVCLFFIWYLNNENIRSIVRSMAKTRTELSLRKKSESDLKQRNEQLREIAFLQSHMVRSPVATILGLISLLDLEDISNPINKEVIPKIEVAGRSLDVLIRQIVKETEESQETGEQLSRLT